jgi:hypothetical protein
VVNRPISHARNGAGDIAVSDAFYAALPHIVGTLDRVRRALREEILGQLGWTVALASRKTPPKQLSDAYEQALLRLRDLAQDALRTSAASEFRRYLLAAIAAASGDPLAALALVHLDDSLCCPKCGQLISCPSCGLPADGMWLAR